MRHFVSRLLATDSSDYSSMILRVTLGAIILPHGLQKLLGMFGGSGFSSTMSFFTTDLGLPAIIVLLVILGESLGALALIMGFISRFMAFGIFIIMSGAALMSHIQHGFFINWFGAQDGNGVEFHLLTLGIAFVLMMRGGGAYSLDIIFHKYINHKK